MASSTTWLVALDELIASMPITADGYIPLGYKLLGTTTIAAGSTVTTNDPEIMKFGLQANDTRFAGLFLYHSGLATAADQVRTITTLSVAAAGASNVATITHAGPNTASTTSTTSYILRIHPTILRNLGNEALNRLRCRCMVPLYDGPTDADMQASGITNWTANSGTPFAKQTTASEVFEGARSGVLTDAGSGGDYTQSALNSIGQGKRLNAYALVKADTGTSKFVVLDGAGNEQASVSTTSEDWVFIRKQVSFDSADEQWRLRLQSVGASDAGDWQAAWGVKAEGGRFILPAYLTSRYTPVGVYVADFPDAAAEADTYIAASIDLQALRYGVDYSFQRAFAAANSFICRVDKRWLDYPLFFAFDAPWSAPYGVAATFAADTDTTGCPPHLLIAGCKVLLGERYDYLTDLARQGNDELISAASRLLPEDTVPETSGWAGMFRGAH